MSDLTVVATFTIREGREEEALEALRPVIEQTHDEAGCLTNHFLQPYMAALGTAAAELLSEPPVVRICEPIPLGDPIKGVL